MMKVVLSILFICLSAHNLFASGESSRKRESPRRWTGEEDARLRSAVERMGKAVSWSKISERTFGRSRTSHQCRQRWSNHLDPLLDHEPFNESEREALRVMVVDEGRRDWATIARNDFPTKGELRVRNFGSYLLRSGGGLSGYRQASEEDVQEPDPIDEMPTASAQKEPERRVRRTQRKRERHEDHDHESDEDQAEPESAAKRPIIENDIGKDQGQESAVSLVSLEPPSRVEEQLQEFLISGGQQSDSGVHRGHRYQSPELPEHHVAVVDESSQESPQSPCSDGALGELDEDVQEPDPIDEMPTASAQKEPERRVRRTQRKRERHEDHDHESDEDQAEPESAAKRPIMEDDQGQESAVSLVSLEPPSLVEEQLQAFLISGGQRSESGVHHGYRNQSPELPEYHVAVVDEYSQESPQSPCSDGALGELDFE